MVLALVRTRAMDSCRCTHTKADHEHYRAGSDCGRCGCAKFHRNAHSRRGRLSFRPGRILHFR